MPIYLVKLKNGSISELSGKDWMTALDGSLIDTKDIVDIKEIAEKHDEGGLSPEIK